VSGEKWQLDKCLAHDNKRLISKLSKLKFVKGLPDLKYHLITLLGAFQKEKNVKNVFKSKNIVSTSRLLRFLHIDLFGLLIIASITWMKYG